MGENNKPGIEGKTIAVAGALAYAANHKAFKEWVEEHGGRFTKTVTENTDLVVCNDADFLAAGIKIHTAKELGIPIIRELEIIDMVV